MNLEFQVYPVDLGKKCLYVYNNEVVPKSVVKMLHIYEIIVTGYIHLTLIQ